MGTIISFLPHRPDLRQTLLELEAFSSCGDFMLTEVGHGLDARNIETTATQSADGSFDLHTPSFAAAKIMPPTTPYAVMPRIAVVFAQLIVGGESRGIRPFLVRINETNRMATGVSSRLLPARPGAKIVDHAITYFDHMRLEASSLLGDLADPKDSRKDFFRQISRVTIGTLSLSMTAIPILRLSAFILGRYSQRRLVAGVRPQERVPIISFATQHTPILTALTYASILEAFAEEASKSFTRQHRSPQVQAALACIFKQTAIHSAESVSNELIDRCGWQGLYKHNQVVEVISALRGTSIAEGDILVL
jgi:acyl-CoA oxidase